MDQLTIELTTPIPKGLKDRHTQLINSFKKYAAWMGMTRWELNIEYVPVADNYVMEMEQRSEYYKMCLKIDLAALDEGSIDEYVRHEMFHGMMGIYAKVADSLAGDSKDALGIIEELTTSIFERMPLWNLLETGRKKKR